MLGYLSVDLGGRVTVWQYKYVRAVRLEQLHSRIRTDGKEKGLRAEPGTPIQR